MNILSNVPDEKPTAPLYIEDLDFYAMQLVAFVNAYRDMIYLKTDADVQRLNELEYYAQLLYNRQYSALISNAHEIVKTEKFPPLKPNQAPFDE